MLHRKNSKIVRATSIQLGFESLEGRVVLSASAPVEEGAATVLVAPPRSAALLSEEEIAIIRLLPFSQFPTLDAEEITYLTAIQVASIPSAFWFEQIPQASRNALTEEQIPHLNVGTIGIGKLTMDQHAWLIPPQIRLLKHWEFKYLNASQTPHLLPSQIASIPEPSDLPNWKPGAIAALTEPQVQAWNVGALGAAWLSPEQHAWLTPAQVRQLKHWEFRYLNSSQTPELTTTQVAGIPNPSDLPNWKPGAIAALTEPQVQAWNMALGAQWLSSAQHAWLTTEQIERLRFWEFQYLTPAQIPDLTADQIASIENSNVLTTLKPGAVAALTEPQIQALKVGVTGILLLSTTQHAWLTPAQVQTLKVYEFHYLNELQTPHLTIPQIQLIQVSSALDDWSEAAIHALVRPQIEALNVNIVGIGLLSPQQIAWLTLAQIQTLKVWEYKLLHSSQIPSLSVNQIQAISNTTVLTEWSPESRAALTQEQIRAIDVVKVTILSLSAEQIGWLSTAQIQALQPFEFPLLSVDQLPLLTPQQFSQVADAGLLMQMPEEKQLALTREQLLHLPLSAWRQYSHLNVAFTPPSSYHPVAHTQIGPDGVAVGGHYDMEGERLLALVPYASVTHKTIASGDWSDPDVWENGAVPAAGAKALISRDTTVNFNVVMTTAIDTLRIDGVLSFAPNLNTQMMADTIIVDTRGTLHIGTEASPIQDDVSARIVIPAGGPINTAWDPHMLSRGVVSRGIVRMYGRYVTPFVNLADTNVAVGTTELHLATVPTNWREGDELVIAGTQHIPGFGADKVILREINGSTITVDALQYRHDIPPGHGLSIQVANLTRNVNLFGEPAAANAQRPHFAFFHNPNVKVENINVTGFGRTDKTREINEPIYDGGVLRPGTGLNVRARYSIHFHHTGVNPAVAPAVVRGSVVVDSPGWGYVNHSSNVIMEDNIAFEVVGSSFASEDGNEIGVMRRNLSLNSRGAGVFDINRSFNHDFAYLGHGFWFQGPGIVVEDNISAGSGFAAFNYTTTSSKNMFDAVNLPDPAMAGGRETVPVGAVPLNTFRNNTAYTAGRGLEIWYSMRMMNDGESVIDNFTAWNTTGPGIEIFYSAHVTINNARLIGTTPQFQYTAVVTNHWTHDVTLNDIYIEGYETGIDVPLRRSTVINGATIAAVRGLYIEKGHDAVRSLQVTEPIVFVPLTSGQLQGRQSYRYYLDGAAIPAQLDERRPESFFNADLIEIAVDGGLTQHLYFLEQAPGSVPFPAATAPGYIPADYRDKSNQQLWDGFQTAFNGGLPPQGSTTPAGYHAYVVGATTPTVSADFDGNGQVDGADFLLWQRGYGRPPAGPADGDANNDGQVDASDLAVWRDDHGAAAATATATVAALAPASPAVLRDDEKTQLAAAAELAGAGAGHGHHAAPSPAQLDPAAPQRTHAHRNPFRPQAHVAYASSSAVHPAEEPVARHESPEANYLDELDQAFGSLGEELAPARP